MEVDQPNHLTVKKVINALQKNFLGDEEVVIFDGTNNTIVNLRDVSLLIDTKGIDKNKCCLSIPRQTEFKDANDIRTNH